MDYNSSKNQDIKGQLIEREVMCCVTDMAEYIIRKSEYEYDNDVPFSSGDIENYFMPVCSECNSSYGFEELDEAFKCEECDTIYETIPFITCCEIEDEDSEDVIGFNEIDEAYKCKNCGAIFESINDLDQEPQEIYEWWAVTTWFGEKLKDKGEPVVELWGKSLWGRTGTGQAIKLDSVISEIAEEMEILEGQKYEWSVN